LLQVAGGDLSAPPTALLLQTLLQGGHAWGGRYSQLVQNHRRRQNFGQENEKEKEEQVRRRVLAPILGMHLLDDQRPLTAELKERFKQRHTREGKPDPRPLAEDLRLADGVAAGFRQMIYQIPGLNRLDRKRRQAMPTEFDLSADRAERDRQITALRTFLHPLLAEAAKTAGLPPESLPAAPAGAAPAGSGDGLF
jgi:hypothetical protein